MKEGQDGEFTAPHSFGFTAFEIEGSGMIRVEQADPNGGEESSLILQPHEAGLLAAALRKLIKRIKASE